MASTHRAKETGIFTRQHFCARMPALVLSYLNLNVQGVDVYRPLRLPTMACSTLRRLGSTIGPHAARKPSSICYRGTQAGERPLRKCLRSLCRRVALMRLQELPRSRAQFVNCSRAQLSDWADMSSWTGRGVGGRLLSGQRGASASQPQWQSGLWTKRIGCGGKMAFGSRARCPRKCRETTHARQYTSEVCLQGQGGGGAAAMSANKAPRQRGQQQPHRRQHKCKDAGGGPCRDATISHPVPMHPRTAVPERNAFSAKRRRTHVF